MISSVIIVKGKRFWLQEQWFAQKNRKFVTPKQLCDIGKCGKHGELKIILESYFNEHQAQQEAHPDLQDKTQRHYHSIVS